MASLNFPVSPKSVSWLSAQSSIFHLSEPAPDPLPRSEFHPLSMPNRKQESTQYKTFFKKS